MHDTCASDGRPAEHTVTLTGSGVVEPGLAAHGRTVAVCGSPQGFRSVGRDGWYVACVAAGECTLPKVNALSKRCLERPDSRGGPSSSARGGTADRDLYMEVALLLQPYVGVMLATVRA